MSARDLKEKYGINKISSALNAAVRAELINGAKILDACQLLREAEKAFVDRNMEEYLPDLRRAIRAAEEVKEMLRDVIRDRYQIGGGDATQTD